MVLNFGIFSCAKFRALPLHHNRVLLYNNWLRYRVERGESVSGVNWQIDIFHTKMHDYHGIYCMHSQYD